MIVEFTVGNFKSYRDRKTISLVASSDTSLLDQNIQTVPRNLEYRGKPVNLLRSAVVYGANASGKSNLLDAIAFVKGLVFNSVKEMQPNDQINVEVCGVAEESGNAPAHFEVLFYQDSIPFRYGFEVTPNRVENEWLFYSPKGREAKLFVRNGDEFDIGSYFGEGRGLPDKTRENALFLSVCAQFNGALSRKVLAFFTNLNVISGINDRSYLQFTLNRLDDETFRNDLIRFIRFADLGIENLRVEEHEIQLKELPDEVLAAVSREIASRHVEAATATVQELRFTHAKFKGNERSGVVAFEPTQESQGTQKLLAIAGPIIDTLENGKVLFVDELDTKLHPLLTQFLIKLFNSSLSNKKGAQLFFATHDTNLLSARFFRRDQIWFTEKDKCNSTDLYSLSDFRVRKDASIGKDYIMGKYGAIPYLHDSSHVLGDADGESLG